MSKSRKKTPVYKMIGCKWFKKYFNRNVRRKGLEGIGKGNWYKKLNNSYDICDYVSYETLGSYIQLKRESCLYLYGRKMTDGEIKEETNNWHKYYKRK